mmetsp:Transcript_28521/g.69124  ORF Transcript_28521/g.69124 Transcript_28521/m.69124 type:complete len:114 (-) Transcript_28521:655-996(-)
MVAFGTVFKESHFALQGSKPKVHNLLQKVQKVASSSDASGYEVIPFYASGYEKSFLSSVTQHIWNDNICTALDSTGFAIQNNRIHVHTRMWIIIIIIISSKNHLGLPKGLLQD